MPQRLDRRGLFRRMAGRPTPQHPPWAVAENLFASLCTGCGDCIRSCPETIVTASAGNLPQVDFSRGGCTFCGRCAQACASGALAGALPAPAWRLRALVSGACLEPKGIACRVCETACDAAALRFRPVPGGRAQVIVSAERCTGCGACVSVCPAGAIVMAAPEPQPEKEETAA